MTNLLHGAHVANKLFSTIARLRLLLVMFLALIVTTNAWAEEGEATITFSNAGLSNQQSVNGTSFALGDYFTVTYAKNGSSTNPTYYTSGTAIRCYVTKSTSNGNTITINQTENGKGVNAYITSVTYSGKNNQGTTSFVYSGIPTNSSNYSVAYSDASKVTSVVATLKETGGSKNGQFYSTGITITYTYTAGGGAPVDPYTVTLDAGSGTCAESVTEPNAGDGVTLPTPTLSSACQSEGWIFAGWATASVDTETKTEPTLIPVGTYKPTSDITLYAIYQRTETTEGVETTTTTTDKLTRATTGVNDGSTTYSTWSNKTITSSAVYAGNSAGSNNSIQLRSNNSNSGVITTTSGGKAKKVTVEWQSSTASGRTLDIYGKNSAYSAATDLYDNSKQGTKLGSIVNGTSTELTITGDYEYIGLCSNSGAMYLTSISIDWATTTGGSTSSTTYYHSTPECTTKTSR